jgi:hypothetical protein
VNFILENSCFLVAEVVEQINTITAVICVLCVKRGADNQNMYHELNNLLNEFK